MEMNQSSKAVFSPKSNSYLKKSTQFLFGIALIGQLIFALYIISYYGGHALVGDFQKWSDAMYVGFIEGDWIGNSALIIHLFFAAIIILGGPLQFIPKIRSKYPVFHRWNGRVYIFTALIISLAGLYMVHTRAIIGGGVMVIGNTLNASLIILFAILTWRTAVQKDFIAHRKWALRTFVVANGVWFFRVGFGLWIILNGGAPGSNESLTGLFDRFLIFAQTLLPLAILEIYFWVKAHANSRGRFILSGTFVLLGIALAAGIFMAAMIFWMPHE